MAESNISIRVNKGIYKIEGQCYVLLHKHRFVYSSRFSHHKSKLFMLFQGVRNLSIETASVTAGAAVTTAAADA